MQSEVSTSLVSKIGKISLTTFETKNPSLVLEHAPESIFGTFRRTRTRSLLRRATKVPFFPEQILLKGRYIID